MSDDVTSVFSDGGDELALPYSFSLSALNSVVNAHFQASCELSKLAEGAYHKVYDILDQAEISLGVARVACPAFPRDKLESEESDNSYGYISTHTNLPVPNIFTWDSNASNAIGAEYMIMQKLRGTPADEIWDTLAPRIRERVVCQLAEYLSTLFTLRFDRLGSLYPSNTPLDDDIIVGPIVGEPYYDSTRISPHAEDMEGRTWLASMNSFRGPYTTTADYLRGYIIPELHFATHYPSVAQAQLDKKNAELDRICYGPLELAEGTLRKLVHLCSLYPGDTACPYNNTFSLSLADFRLPNILIDPSTGHVTGLIDLEGTRVAPLWECALLPRWLQPYSDLEGAHAGGTRTTRRILRELFLSRMPEDWLDAYRWGRPYRLFREKLNLPFVCWATEEDESYVDELLAWAKENPGVGLPEITRKAYWERHYPGVECPSSSSESEPASDLGWQQESVPSEPDLKNLSMDLKVFW